MCATTDKQERLRHVGQRNKHGWASEELSVILRLCKAAAALGITVAQGLYIREVYPSIIFLDNSQNIQLNFIYINDMI